MNLAHWLERTAATQGVRPALFYGTEQVADYTGFHKAAMGLAGALRARGIAPGDRVAMFMKNCPEYLIAFFGIWAAGAAAVPINAKLHPKEAAFILENSGTRLVLVTPELSEDLAAVTGAERVDVKSAEFAAMCAHDPAPVAHRAPACPRGYSSPTGC
jgi:long-chain acyl-CoA synthetase